MSTTRNLLRALDEPHPPMPTPVPPKPIAVPIVAAFLFAAAAIAAIVGPAVLFPGTRLDRLWELNRPGAALFHQLGRAPGVLLWGLAIATVAAGRGLLQRARWAWWFAVALFAAELAGSITACVVGPDPRRGVSGLAASCGFLYALGRPKVRRYFGTVTSKAGISPSQK